MNLDPDMLAALAEGVSRLEDGDLQQCQSARNVRIKMIKEHGLVLSYMGWIPTENVTSGYIRPHKHAYQDASGKWWIDGHKWPQELAPGQVLYFDIDCTVPLRTLGARDDREDDRERNDALEEATREKIERERAEVYDHNHREE